MPNIQKASLILASASPRRKELLKLMGLKFIVKPSNIDENEISQKNSSISPKKLIALIALKKAQKVLADLKNKSRVWILAADTGIQFKNKLLGKPQNQKEAYQFLKMLSHKTHFVHTALVLLIPQINKPILKTCTTKVKFRKLTDKEIKLYLKTNEWQDAAGAYRIQGKAIKLISWIKGSYSNVVGLPLEVLFSLLQENGFWG